MPAWKILLTDGLEEKGKHILSAAGEVDDRSGISPEDLLKIVSQYDALIVRGRTKVNAQVLSAGTNLKVVGRSGVGVDNIDVKAASQRNITVVNAPTATTVAVAELTLGLMLALVRDIPRADASMKDGKWLKKEFEGKELFGKTLGVLGFGRIGGSVARRAVAFDMKVITYDTRFTEEKVRIRGGQMVSLEELFTRSDFITIHVPYMTSTHHMINAAAIEKMKRGVYLICAARGGIIDEAALLDALDSGKIAGAGLDVFETEPPGLTPLVSHPRVIAVPHIGAQTVEAQQRAAYDIATEVLAALDGKPLRWKVA
jgi:D-3-phosphoglycerate dehydrogenase